MGPKNKVPFNLWMHDILPGCAWDCSFVNPTDSHMYINKSERMTLASLLTGCGVAAVTARVIYSNYEQTCLHNMKQLNENQVLSASSYHQ